MDIKFLVLGNIIITALIVIRFVNIYAGIFILIAFNIVYFIRQKDFKKSLVNVETYISTELEKTVKKGYLPESKQAPFNNAIELLKTNHLSDVYQKLESTEGNEKVIELIRYLDSDYQNKINK